jgi:hypothetical protein
MPAENLFTLFLAVLMISVAVPAAGWTGTAHLAATMPAASSTFPIAELTGSDTQQYSSLGTSVAVNGNTIVVGAPGIADGQGNFVAGAAYVYVKPPSGWGNMTQVAKLTASDNGGSRGFGDNVAINGNTIVVNSNLPELYVFTEPVGGWTDMTETAILSVPSVGLGPCLCGQIAIDGDTIVVGSPLDAFGNFGSIEIFAKPSTGNWASTSEPNAVLTQADAQYESQSFRSVAISGNTVVGVGLVFNGDTAEYFVFLFLKPTSGWNGDYTPQAVLSSTQALNYFGSGQVSISGNTVVAGSPSPNLTFFPPGFTDVWVEPASGWANMNETAQLSDGNTTYADGFGTATAIAGNRIVVGTPEALVKNGVYRGAAYVYTKPASGWQTTTKYSGRLLNSDWTNFDGFGSSVSVFNGTTVVGEPNGPKGADVGAAYVFGK